MHTHTHTQKNRNVLFFSPAKKSARAQRENGVFKGALSPNPRHCAMRAASARRVSVFSSPQKQLFPPIPSFLREGRAHPSRTVASPTLKSDPRVRGGGVAGAPFARRGCDAYSVSLGCAGFQGPRTKGTLGAPLDASAPSSLRALEFARRDSAKSTLLLQNRIERMTRF